MVEGWKYYNHALLPSTAPHVVPDVKKMKSKDFWASEKGKVLLARWTSDYDCTDSRNWWYIVKDDKFDINSLKSKRRYEINKGKKNFRISRINTIDYVDELIDIHIRAYEQYPMHYRPVVNKRELAQEIMGWNGNIIIFGAFETETNNLCGFAMIIEYESYANFAMLKVVPICERNGINAAVVAGVLEYYDDRLGKEGGTIFATESEHYFMKQNFRII